MGRSYSLILLACVTLALGAKPNYVGTIERSLRYAPEGRAFLIRNGEEYFNRPLYGVNTAFRVDAGDRPEFAFYLPGRGGNLRLGIRMGGRSKWLTEADSIEARYVDGAVEYVVSDPLLGGGSLRIGVVTTPGRAAIFEIQPVGKNSAADAVELVAAFGGVTGKRARRDGDIGTESLPIREFFQLKPVECEGGRVPYHIPCTSQHSPDKFRCTCYPAVSL